MRIKTSIKHVHCLIEAFAALPKEKKRTKENANEAENRRTALKD